MFDSLLIAGRFWDSTGNASQILAWAKAHAGIAELAVAINVANDKSNAVQALQEAGTATPIPVQPWLRWSPALLALTAEAVKKEKKYVLFLSTTMRIDEVAVSAMLEILEANPDIMHLGPAFPEHDFSPGRNTISGRRVPWNNCSIHRTEGLAGVGYQPVSEGLMDPKAQGVEEVVYDSLNQKVRGSDVWRVLLVKNFPGMIVWDVTKDSHGAWYLVYHDEKLASKDERPSQQLQLIGLEPGVSWHSEYAYLVRGMPWNR